MWLGTSGQQRALKGHSRGSKQWEPMLLSGSGPASISSCRLISSGTAGSNSSTSSVTSVRANSSPRSGFRWSVLRCMISARFTSMSFCFRTWVWMAASQTWWGFWEVEDLTSIRLKPLPLRSRISTATNTPSSVKEASNTAGAPAASALRVAVMRASYSW